MTNYIKMIMLYHLLSPLFYFDLLSAVFVYFDFVVVSIFIL